MGTAPVRLTRVTVEFERQECDDSDSSPLEWLDESDERVTAWRRGDWHFIGIRAKATVTVHDVRNRYSTCYTMESAGLWGIESDSGADYLADVYREQCAELRADIEAIARGPIEYK